MTGPNIRQEARKRKNSAVKCMLALYLFAMLTAKAAFSDSDVVPDASMVDTSVTNFNAALSSSDNTVQKALDTLDDSSDSSSINVETYGVLCDNSTDNSTTLQNALNACGSTDKICQIPPGTCKFSTGLTVPTGVFVNGSGQAVSILSYTGSGTAFSNATPGTRIYNWQFENLKISTSTGDTGILLDSVSSSSFRNVIIDGFTTGWDIYSPTSGYAVYNRFYNTNANQCGTGYKMRGTSSNANVFVSARANAFTSAGFSISDSNDNTIDGCQIESNSGTGVIITASIVAVSDANRITNSRFEGSMTKAMSVGLNVRRTFISNIAAPGIAIADVLDDSGTGTMVFGVSPANTDIGAIRVTGAIIASANDAVFAGRFSNSTTGANARLDTSATGSTISREIADSNPVLIIKNSHASSTGDITQFQNSAATVGIMDLNGNLKTASYSSNNSDPADSEIIRLGNGEGIAWEASAAGTDVIMKADSSEIIQITGGTLDGADLSANSVTSSQISTSTLTSGTYTPTRSAETNLDANVTMTEAQYMRVGNTVTVSGRFTADPTLTATTTDFEITLPVASNIGATEDAGGVAFCGNIVSQGAEVIGVVANDTAQIQWKSSDVTSQVWAYTFSYQII